MSQAKYLVMLGAPGAGKGTQARLMEESLGIPQVSTGDLFRYNLSRETELGLLAKSYMEKGVLVPDDVTVRMVEERLSRPDCAVGAILDGFPRNLDQARALDELLAKMGQQVTMALYVKVDREDLIARLTGRRICKSCQAAYHVLFNPPAREGVCDECGGELYQRADDTRETVEKRLEVYFEQTAPLIDYYREQGVLAEVDGGRSIAEVQEEILQRVRGE
jgi:adenylate kinase